MNAINWQARSDMSESPQPSQAEGENRSSRFPRAIVHKKILDIAEDEPDASIEELAGLVNGVSVDMVEQVLEEYGDPVADSPTEVEEGANSHTMNEVIETNSSVPEGESHLENEIDLEKITEKQHETLRAIYKNPEATQKELAENFDVSSATICHRVNNIDAFEWDTRQEFVERVFEDKEPSKGTKMSSEKASLDLTDEIDELDQRIQSIERNLKERSRPRTAFDDPDLVHKVVHACMDSDQISEEEELRILKELVGGETNTG
ncbi:MarR family transcriptional regulator [Natrinema halophilum]|uniref:MarR family transcriptional regulator n=1 Tax=Natrinema halophilum TaxID=1699371 RepID=A0A7D5GGR9_9EURY|nr:helix-turn-helix domain-containing protein [Natrinema halophilum]QLG48528.1 winged helix-turn-helix transcriptional regulator [Natrinema halophilum]